MRLIVFPFSQRAFQSPSSLQEQALRKRYHNQMQAKWQEASRDMTCLMV